MHLFQNLLSERDRCQEDINFVFNQGNRLSPSTAPPGRENVRQTVSKLKAEWTDLCSGIDSLQRKVDGVLISWSEYRKDFEKLDQAIATHENQFVEDQSTMKDTIEEKREQLQCRKVRF